MMRGNELIALLRLKWTEALPAIQRSGRALRERWQILSRRRKAAVVITTGVLIAGWTAYLRSGSAADDLPTASVTREDLRVEVSVAGKLVPVRADSYGGEIPGVELKITDLVTEGAQVPAGATLIRFDDSPFRREVDSARTRLVQVRSEAEQARQAVRVLVASERAERGEADASLKRAALELETFEQAMAPLALKESEAAVERIRREAEDARQKVVDLEPFAEKGYISREELRAAKRRAEQAEADLAIATQKHEVLSRYSHPQLLQQKKSDLTTRSEAVRSGTEKAVAQIAQARAALDLAEARVNEGVRAEAEAMRRLELCTVRARSPGFVVYREVFEKGGDRRKVRVGDSAFAGQPLLDLPDLSRMQVDSRIRESEVQSIRPGLSAEIRLDAFPLRSFPGKVVRLGALAAGEKGENRTFPIVLELAEVDSRMRPGMSAQAVIHADESRGVLLVPIEAVRRDREGAYCLVRGLFGVRRARIRTGRASAFQCEVVAGLSRGDLVLLGSP